MGRHPTPTAPHARQTDVRGADLATDGALGVGRQVPLSVVVIGDHLGQCLPGVVSGSLYTVWHGELLLKTRNGEGRKKRRRRLKIISEESGTSPLQSAHCSPT